MYKNSFLHFQDSCAQKSPSIDRHQKHRHPCTSLPLDICDIRFDPFVDMYLDNKVMLFIQILSAFTHMRGRCTSQETRETRASGKETV